MTRAENDADINSYGLMRNEESMVKVKETTKRRHSYKGIIPVLFALLSLMLSGCRVSMGDVQAVIRPATRIPAQSIESGNGEKLVHEEFDPVGDGVFLMMRGHW